MSENITDASIDICKKISNGVPTPCYAEHLAKTWIRTENSSEGEAKLEE